MNSIKKILIIIQRSNGDVFLSTPLINALFHYYSNVKIDLLINDDTLAIAKTLHNINKIHLFSYKKKKENRFKQEIKIIKTIYKKYDLSINLTASDRSVFYSILASSYAISAVEKQNNKSWWKKFFLKKSYVFDTSKHIVLNNTSSLELLGIKENHLIVTSSYTKEASTMMHKRLKELNISEFIIFHPSAQYEYKVYPEHLRNELLEKLNRLNIPIIVTGAKSEIDLLIKSKLPKFENVFDFIGETNLDEYFALSDMSLGYIGMDTLNIHIAASQNKRIFGIYGPTILSTWSPWSNKLQKGTSTNTPKQTYDNITIFQADFECVACGKAGCDDKHGESECLFSIRPEIIFDEVKSWLKK